MIRNHLRPLASLRTVALVLAAAVMLVLAVVAPAMAAAKDFEVFKQCPTKNPSVNLCVYIKSTGKEFKIGTKTVKVNKPITLQGGSILNEETGLETFVEAANGETLSKTPLNVEGGLFGLKAPTWWSQEAQEFFNKQIAEGFFGVTVTAELAKLPGISRANLLEQSGTALSLPVRLHLNNPILGSSCFVGSNKNPVTFNLTSGETSPPPGFEPIKGELGEIEFLDEFQLVKIKGNKVVDNTFEAPEAEGCGGAFAPLLDPIVNKILGLPSSPGHNVAILTGELQNASAEAVKGAGF
jgi:hypothetical protein